MAFRAFAVLVEDCGSIARYDCGITEDGPERGIVWVSADAYPPVGWEDGRPIDKIARGIGAKARRLREETGAWPENASVQAG